MKNIVMTGVNNVASALAYPLELARCQLRSKAKIAALTARIVAVGAAAILISASQCVDVLRPVVVNDHWWHTVLGGRTVMVNDHWCDNCSSLAALASAIALTALCSTNFSLGLGTGIFSNYCKLVVIQFAVSYFDPIIKGESNEAEEKWKRDLHDFLSLVWIGPIVEELVFRATIQPFIKMSAQACLTRASVLPTRSPVAVAKTIAVLATALLFGLVHLTNETGREQKINWHVVSAICGGVVMGVLKERLGLLSSIGAHVGNNFLVAATILFQDKGNR